MELSREQLEKVIKLSERVSDLIVKIADEEISHLKEESETDKEVKYLIEEIKKICPVLSEGYSKMYDYLKKKQYEAKRN
jgi:hypothetical protein